MHEEKPIGHDKAGFQFCFLGISCMLYPLCLGQFYHILATFSVRISKILYICLYFHSKSVIYFKLVKKMCVSHPDFLCIKGLRNNWWLEFVLISTSRSFFWRTLFVLENNFASRDVTEAVPPATAFMDYFPWHFCCTWKQTEERKTKGGRENCGIADNDTPLQSHTRALPSKNYTFSLLEHKHTIRSTNNYQNRNQASGEAIKYKSVSHDGCFF